MDPKPYNSKKDLKYIQSVLKSIQSDVNLIKKHLMSMFYEDPDTQEQKVLYPWHQNGKAKDE